MLTSGSPPRCCPRQYLNTLSVHIAAASGGSISMLRLPPDSDEVRQVFVEMGAPAIGPMQVLHAYRLRNGRLFEGFNELAGGDVPQLGASPTTTGARASPTGARASPSPGAMRSKGSKSPLKQPPPPPVEGGAFNHRLLAMRLAPSAVEHVLVHGLRPKVDAGGRS